MSFSISNRRRSANNPTGGSANEWPFVNPLTVVAPELDYAEKTGGVGPRDRDEYSKGLLGPGLRKASGLFLRIGRTLNRWSNVLAARCERVAAVERGYSLEELLQS